MKNIVLAAGYATRLYPLTENFPKPLLKIGHSTILSRLIEDVDLREEISEHIVVTNHRFYDIFLSWSKECKTQKPITIIDDKSLNNETRLGAVNDLLLAIEKEKIKEDILVMAGDNILDFSFSGFIEFSKQKNSSCIMFYEEKELEKLQRTGVILIDETSRVLKMQEKPEKPISFFAVPPFYIYKKEDFLLIKESIKNGCESDAPGNLARYLIDKTLVYAYRMPGKRFDIGSIDSYEKAKKDFE